MPLVSAEFRTRIAQVHGAAGAEWLAALPALLANASSLWSLRLGPPLRPLSYPYFAPALRADGTEAILKAGVPCRGLTTEVEALRHYDGRGAARLLGVHPDGGLLLLERLRPGRALWSLADDQQATAAAAQVMRQLRRPVPSQHSFPTVAEWAQGLHRARQRVAGGTGPLPAALLARAESLFAELLGSSAEPIVLHGDLHHGNILAARREPWLAIDPKGVVGEPAYEVGALLRNPLGRLPVRPQLDELLARRAHQLADELSLSRDRVLGWALAQAVLAAWWCIEDGDDCGEAFVACAEALAAAPARRRPRAP